LKVQATLALDEINQRGQPWILDAVARAHRR
jgi:hypothetical protein